MIIDRFNLFADNVTPTFTVSTNQLLGVSVDLGEYLGEVDLPDKEVLLTAHKGRESNDLRQSFEITAGSLIDIVERS